MNNSSSITLEGYQICQTAGSGAFAKVYKAENEKTHQIVAIKAIPKPTKLADKIMLKQELQIQKSIQHPSIAKFIEAKEDDNFFYIISEYCSHGTLADLIQKNSRIPENLVRKYFIQVVKCLKYLHEEAHVIHRDLKAENIMIDSLDNIKIIDFGLSTEFNPEYPFIKHNCGSPKYVAPEIFSGDAYDSSVDIWALGVNLFYWICGYYPFDDTNLKKLSRKVLLEEPSYPSYLSSNLIDLLKQIFVKNPSKRITCSEILKHPWTLNDKNTKNSNDNNEVRIKFAKSVILPALENDENLTNFLTPTKKKEIVHSDGLTHLFEPQGSSVVDRLCATGKFKRKEKKVIEQGQSKNYIVNAFVSSCTKKNNEST